MAFITKYPPQGQGSTVAQISSYAALLSYGPANGAQPGDVAIVLDTFELYTFTSSAVWQLVGGAAPDLSLYLKRDGSQPPTADMPWGSKKLLDVSAVSFSGNISLYSSDSAALIEIGNSASAANTRCLSIGTLRNGNGTMGQDCTSVGEAFGADTKLGDRNSVFGARAYAGSSSVPGVANSVFGAVAGNPSATNVSNNCIFGAQSAFNITTASDNVIMGMNAATTLTTGNGNIIIGKSAQPSSPTASGELRIGSAFSSYFLNGDSTKLVIEGGRNLRVQGNLGVGNSAAATTPGSVVKKIEVFDASGISLGFVPVYDAIV